MHGVTPNTEKRAWAKHRVTARTGSQHGSHQALKAGMGKAGIGLRRALEASMGRAWVTPTDQALKAGMGKA